MKNKLKYLLFGLLTLISLSSTTYALEVINTDYSQDSKPVESGKMYKVNYTQDLGSKSLFLYPFSPKFCTRFGCQNTPSEAYSEGKNVFTPLDGKTLNIRNMTHGGGKNFYADSANNYVLPVFRDGNNFYVALDLRGENIDNVDNVLFTYSAKSSETIKSKRGTHIYSSVVPQAYGLALVSDYENDFKSSSVILNSYILDGFFLYWNGTDGENEFWLIDTYEGKAYIYKNSLFKYQNLFNNGYIDFFYRLRNIAPSEVAGIGLNAGTDRLRLSNVPGGGGSQKFVNYVMAENRVANDGDHQALKSKLADSLLTINHGKIFIKVSAKELGQQEEVTGNGDKNDANNQSQSQEQYNQCVNYWEDVKVLASYMGECRKAIGATSAGLLPYADFERWEKLKNEDRPTFNIPLPENFPISCRKSEKLRERLEKRYPEKYEEILDQSEDYANNPSLINVELKCSSKLISKKEKNEEAEKYSYFASSGFTNTLKELVSYPWDWFRGRRGEPAMTTEDGEKLYAVDFDPDFTSLRSLYWQCQGLDRFGITKSFTQTPEEKQKACSDYASKKAEILKKWQGANLGDFYGNTVAGAIAKIEKKKNQDGLIKTFGSEFKESLSEGGEALLNAVQSPFNSGYNSVLPLQCSSTHRHIEIMDYFLWGLFAIVAFILFKFF